MFQMVETIVKNYQPRHNNEKITENCCSCGAFCSEVDKLRVMVKIINQDKVLIIKNNKEIELLIKNFKLKESNDLSYY